MSKKTTRSSKPPAASPKQQVKVAAVQKVFFIPQKLLDESSGQLQLEYFFHPGKGKPALFMTNGNCDIMEVLEFAEPRRSWLINNDVCSNGRLYLTTPVDVTFLVLHHLRKHCSQKALALDNIGDVDDSSTLRLLREFVGNGDQLKYIADVKVAGSMMFYKYNCEKTLAWLSAKVRRVATKLQSVGAHCGHSAVSQNYVRGDLGDDAGEQTSMDYLRMACDIVGDYCDLDLHEELQKYLEITVDAPSGVGKKVDKADKGNKKRKSLQPLNSTENKKIKMESSSEEVTAKLDNSSLVKKQDSGDTESESGSASSSNGVQPMKLVEVVLQPSPVKERTLTAKEKALAKSAKGTKSIAAFFKK